ncbi:hypothetical protein LTS10_001344 [Elasticomyces elasticus]|nr:hypothetical protein LTS10_001344 [Elasticomyces elasticus]
MDTDSASDGGGYGDVPTRPMRVKVLYSFDQDNKTNCLARLPNTMQIPAVAINETAQVGVIDLQQCIQAVTSASPEVVSRLSEGDYTVYAYDYSEEDTPLVGQGMLSAALAAASAGVGAEQAMITGRVCKNMQALFSNGVKETLEVKLRLVPVPRPAIGAVAKTSSPATTAGFDPNAWNSSLQQSRLQQELNSYFDFQPSQTESPNDMAVMDEMFGLATGGAGSASGPQLLGGVGIAETPTDPTYGQNPAFSHSAPGSRAGSPMMGLESGTHNEQLRHQSFAANAPNFADHSRPGSRASVRSEVQSSHHQRQASTQSLPLQQSQQTDIYYNEDGQSRKRAKITQTDWHGRSSFGTKSGDLRVTAATAHSVHMHRPIATRHGAPGTDLEPPPRAPTPVPQMNPMLRQQRPSQPARSFLRQASTVDSDFMSDIDQYSDATMTPPDDEGSPTHSLAPDATPQDIPSSPPVLMGVNYAQPSSPGLPTLPVSRPLDSGYMSGNVLDDYDCDDENRSPDAEDLEMAAQYHARESTVQRSTKTERASSRAPANLTSDAFASEIGVAGQIVAKTQVGDSGRQRLDSQGPTQPNITKVTGKQERVTQSMTTAQPARPAISASRRSSFALPTKAPAPPPKNSTQQVNDPKRPVPKRKYTKRTRAGGTHAAQSEAGSPAPSDTESLDPNGRSGSGAQRRHVIQQRLEAALASNTMPQHCVHCGAIETATWRRIYVRYFDGKPSPLDSCEGEGETVGVESISRDPTTHEITRYMIRKTMKKTRESTPGEGFEPVIVCNPCGLWFNKFRNMRPQEKWNRKSSKRRPKRNGAGGNGPATDGPEPQSDAFFTDQVGPDDVDEQEAGIDRARLDGTDPVMQVPQPLAAARPRANSMQPLPRRRSGDGMNASQLDAALSRAVQSSPVPFRGSQASPIEIGDITPDRPTRRLLFPSPRRSGEVKSLDDNGQASLNATPPAGKGFASKPSSLLKVGVPAENTDVSVFDAFTFDKENMEPDLDDDLMQLFEGSPSAASKTPCKTPGMTPRSQHQFDQLLKTPTPASRKRKPLTPNANAVNNASAALNDFVTSPSSSRYFLRSTPSRQDRTPVRASQGVNVIGADMTPFSRHLAQILSEANEGGAVGAFTSPSRALDFSDLPAFSTTPGKSLAEVDWSGMEDILSSDFAAYGGDQAEADSAAADQQGGGEQA